MTDNMEYIYNDIMGCIFNCLPAELLDFCFEESYPVPVTEFAMYVILEFVKDAYYDSLEKHSLRYYLDYNADDDDHSERMRFSRAFRYAQKFKDLNYKILGEQAHWDPKKMEEYKPLLSKDMTDMNNRIDGYEWSEMDLFEIATIQDLRIIKSIAERRIVSSKKVSNQLFVELFEEYDKWVDNLKARASKSDDDLIFASMAFFTLEWKYSLEFIYLVADFMEYEKIEEVDLNTLWALAMPLQFDSIIGATITSENRMIKERQYLIPDFFGKDINTHELMVYRWKYIEIVGVSALLNEITCIEGDLYKEWFGRNSTVKDWASFMREYDIFSVCNKKEWTNKKIQNVRKIIKMILPFDKKM